MADGIGYIAGNLLFPPFAERIEPCRSRRRFDRLPLLFWVGFYPLCGASQCRKRKWLQTLQTLAPLRKPNVSIGCKCPANEHIWRNSLCHLALRRMQMQTSFFLAKSRFWANKTVCTFAGDVKPLAVCSYGDFLYLQRHLHRLQFAIRRFLTTSCDSICAFAGRRELC